MFASGRFEDLNCGRIAGCMGDQTNRASVCRLRREFVLTGVRNGRGLAEHEPDAEQQSQTKATNNRMHMQDPTIGGGSRPADASRHFQPIINARNFRR